MTEEEELYFGKLQQEADEFFDFVKKHRRFEKLIEAFFNNLYASETHFLLELIQNADDACATETYIHIKRKAIVFFHNGKNFSITDPENEKKEGFIGEIGDVNSICSFFMSTKDFEEENDGKYYGNKIGKFGIGFKSVFKYTDSPIIVCRNQLCFKIEKKIKPIPCDESSLDIEWPETLGDGNATAIILPFNADYQEPYEIIKKVLSKAHFPLLFTNNIERIIWKDEAEGEPHINSISKYALNAESEKLTVDDCKYNQDGVEYNYLKFSSKVPIKNNVSSCKNLEISICIFYRGDELFFPEDATEELKYVHCYFPTKLKTNLNFVVHAPFLLDVSRSHLREELQEKAINTQLMESLGKLTAQSLRFLVENRPNMMGESAYMAGIIPYDKDLQDIDNGLFAPFYNECKALFETQRMLPSVTGEFILGGEACWGPSNMEKLFTQKHLSMLNKYAGRSWIFPSINSTNDTKLKDFAESVLGVTIIDKYQMLDAIVKQLRRDDEFIRKQTFEWLNDFYLYIHRCKYQEMVTSPIFIADDQSPYPLKDASGQVLYVRAQDFNGELYGNFKFIDQRLFNFCGTQKLFEDWGAKQLGMLEICQNNLTAHNWGNHVTKQEYINCIVPTLESFFRESSHDAKHELVNLLKKNDFKILCSDLSGKHEYLVSINSAIYNRNSNFFAYLKLITNAKYAELDIYNSIDGFEKYFPIIDFPRLSTKELRPDIKYYYPHGISDAIQHIVSERNVDKKRAYSRIVWHILIESIKRSNGRTFRTSNYEPVTGAVPWLTEPWVIKVNGEFASPKQVLIRDIDFGFYRCEQAQCNDLLRELHICDVQLPLDLQAKVDRHDEMRLNELTDNEIDSVKRFIQNIQPAAHACGRNRKPLGEIMQPSTYPLASAMRILFNSVHILDPLLDKNVLRTQNSPTGDYGEWIIARALGLQLTAPGYIGCDAVDYRNGIEERIQIKASRIPLNRPYTSIQLSAIRSLDDFDSLICIIFSRDYQEIISVLQVSALNLKNYSSLDDCWNAYQRAWSFHVSDLQCCDCKDLTVEVRNAIQRLIDEESS